MSNEPDLVSLLYRADWTRLSLAAEVSTSLDLDLFHSRFEDEPPPAPPRWPWPGPREPRPAGNEWEVATELQGIQSGRSTLLIAPGRRYREQSESFLSGCDGDRRWHAVRDDDGWTVDETGGPEPPLEELLRPSWLLSGYTLEPGERVTVSGRDALRAVAAPRPRIWHRPMALRRPLDRVEVTVDTELGILLRQEEFLDGRTLRVSELTDVLIDPAPADDDVWCQPPGGWDSVDDSVPRVTPDGPGWEVAKLAAGLAAGGLGALIRSSRSRPFEQATQEEAEAEMPQDLEPWPPDAPPASDAVLHLLHASRDRWAPGITATMHQWHDIAAMLSRVPDSARRTGFGGLGFLIDTAGERIATLHTVSRLTLGGSGQYRIEPVAGVAGTGRGRPGRHRPETVVCDGERRWRIGEDEVTAGPAGPPPRETASMFDASWLLEHRLTGGFELMADDRRGYRVRVGMPADLALSWFIFPEEVVVDAELGIVLRWISFSGSQPMMRYELRDVTTGPLEPGAFQPDIPPGMRVVEEPDGPPGPVNPASVIARQAAIQARSAVRNFLGLIRGDDAR